MSSPAAFLLLRPGWSTAGSSRGSRSSAAAAIAIGEVAADGDVVLPTACLLRRLLGAHVVWRHN